MGYREINADFNRIDLKNSLRAAPCRRNTPLKQRMGRAFYEAEGSVGTSITFMPFHLQFCICTAFLHDFVPQSECLQGVCAHWNL